MMTVITDSKMHFPRFDCLFSAGLAGVHHDVVHLCLLRLNGWFRGPQWRDPKWCHSSGQAASINPWFSIPSPETSRTLQEAWGHIPDCMITLFTMTTLSDWSEQVRHVAVYPSLETVMPVFTILFLAICSLGTESSNGIPWNVWRNWGFMDGTLRVFEVWPRHTPTPRCVWDAYQSMLGTLEVWCIDRSIVLSFLAHISFPSVISENHSSHLKSI